METHTLLDLIQGFSSKLIYTFNIIFIKDLLKSNKIIPKFNRRATFNTIARDLLKKKDSDEGVLTLQTEHITK